MLSACATSLQPPTQLTRGDYSDTQDYITRLIEKKMDEDDIVGLSIALVDDQTLVWADGFGWADVENKIKTTPRTVYRVGSITKLFTATAAMQLAEQGKIDIDQPLKTALPSLSIKSRFNKKSAVTPRNIMTHHSGLPSNYMNGMWVESPDAFTRLVYQLETQYMAYPPDTILSYSNVGVTLLGHAVQEVSDQPYSEYVEQALLAPMGMSDSYVATVMKDDLNSSKGYHEGQEITAMPLRDLPAGALNSTVLDLARFAQMVFGSGRYQGRQIITAGTLNDMLNYQDGDAPFDLSKSVGLGWFLSERFGDEAGLIASHDGGTVLFHSHLMALPKHRLAVVVLANSALAGSAVADIAEQALKLALETKIGIKVMEQEDVPDIAFPVKGEDLLALPGYYSTQLGIVEIERKDDRLKMHTEDQSLNLVLREDGRYYLQYKLFGLVPVGLGGWGKLGLTRDEIAGREILIAHHNDRKMLAGEKIIPKPLPDAWQQRLGRYEVVDPQPGLTLKDVALDVDDGLLIFKFRISMSHLPKEKGSEIFALVAANDSEAIIHGLGRGRGDTLQAIHRNGEELLNYSGFLLRRIP